MLLLLLYGLLHLPSVQTWLVKQATVYLSDKLKTKVSIQTVDFSFFNKLEFKGLMIEDRAKDTLLYAGAAKVRINDWFFAKDKITLHYIGLEDALVNMNRKDSVWNYQFLIDYFSSPSSGKSNKKSIEFDVKEAHFTNIRFNNKDQWIGQDMIFSVQQMDIMVDLVDLIKKKISVKSIDLDNPSFTQNNYTGNRPEQPEIVTDPVVPETKDTAGNGEASWQIELTRLLIKNGIFQNEKETIRKRYSDQFDGQHLLFSGINAEIRDISIFNDTVKAGVLLSGKEQSGLEIKKLQANMKLTPEMMEFSNLDLVTNKSQLRNYFAMRYSSFNTDMNNFISNVILEGHFKGSKIHSDDIAFFAPSLRTWKKIFQMEGNAKGTVDNFTIKQMNIKSAGTTVKGDISLRGLPDINTTFIDYKSEGLQTNYADLVTLIPALKKVDQPNLSKLGKIYYKGNFTGFINDFVAYGTIITDLGMVTADLNMKLPENGIPLYSGKLLTNNFRLGEFTSSTQVGNISLNGKIKGSGFSLKDLNANFDGYMPLLEFNGYKFQNIKASGDIVKSKFNGHLTIDDPNLKINSLDGSLSLTGKDIAFNLDADLAYANLKNIRFTKEDFILSGKFNLDFTGNNIDNFLGNAKIYDATLKHDSTILSFDSLNLNSQMIGDRKTLSINSNELEAEISGKFSILELPDAFKVFLSRYYPSYIRKPTYRVSDQDFAFHIKTRNIEEYLKLFDHKISGFNFATLSGKLNLANYELNILANVPDFGYDGKHFTNVMLQGNGTRDTLRTYATIEDAGLSDSLHFPGTEILLSTTNDVTDIHLKTSAGKTLNDAELNASVQTFTDGVKVHFFPSSFIINDKKWLLEKDGELTIRKNFLNASEIKFSHDNQQIVISTEPDALTDKTNIVAKLTSLNMEDFAPFAFKKPAPKGMLSGIATIKDPFGKISVEFKGNADSLSLDNEYIGNVDLGGSYNSNSGMVSFNVNTTDTTNDFNIAGTYNTKDSSDKQIDVSIIAKRINLAVLEPYLKTIFSKMEGMAATKDLKIYGGPGHKYITGEVTILDGSVKIAYTQCRYLLKDETIIFGKDVIDLGMMRLSDTLKNTATLTGKIYHQFFDELQFDNLRMETEKLTLLNTTKYDNTQFYGYVIGRAKLSINGPVTNLRMNIDGEPSNLDSSHIYLPTGAGKESNAVDYIEFIQFGTEMEEIKTSQSTNIIVNLGIRANPACKVDVILDEETGDVIKAQGNGLISIRVGNKEPLTIRGTYQLTKGEYTFNFQTFLKKPFTLNRGSITWNGDPYLANIDIDAEYLAKNVDISSLSSGGGFKQKEDVTIISRLTGVLQKPDIKFEFRLPERSEAKRDDIIVKRLEDFKNNENEMNKQVASLLLFNSFIVGNQNFLAKGSPGTFITSTIGGVVSSLLTNFFNRELEKATKGVLTTYIDINPTFDLQKSAAQLQANVRAGLKILLSNRLVVLVGGNLDYNNSAYAQQLDRKGLLTPDITIEWLINKDGSLRVVGFNRSSIDFSLNQRNRSGLQLSYRKDVNKLSDILRSRKKLAKENELKNPPVNSPESKDL